MSIQAFSSRVSDPESRRFGTFSYLPALGREDVLRQITYAVEREWTCAIEHVEPARAPQTYWYLWKLPLFGHTVPAEVLAEADACRDAHPGDHVRIVAYDRIKQTLGLSMVVHRGPVGGVGGAG